MRCFGIPPLRETQVLSCRAKPRRIDKKVGRPMTVTARERAFALYKEGFDTCTKIRKQLEAEGFEGVLRGNIENWRAGTNGMEGAASRPLRPLPKRSGRQKTLGRGLVRYR